MVIQSVVGIDQRLLIRGCRRIEKEEKSKPSFPKTPATPSTLTFHHCPKQGGKHQNPAQCTPQCHLPHLPPIIIEEENGKEERSGPQPPPGRRKYHIGFTNTHTHTSHRKEEEGGSKIIRRGRGTSSKQNASHHFPSFKRTEKAI